ncbi:hypothetical protein Tco_0591773 [Tanacetum coccineum]
MVMTTMIQELVAEGQSELLCSDVVEFPRQDCWSCCCIRNAMENIEKDDDRQILPKSEIKKLKIELQNLKMRSRSMPGGLPDMIQGSVMASKPKTMQDAIEIANDLMDQKIRTFAERQAENKRKLDNDNQAQQQPPKKQNVAIAYTAGSGERKEYAGTLLLCNKCKFHHTGLCTVKCANYNRIGHYRIYCPELKNRNHRNQAGGAEARGMVYALGGRETDQDIDDMEDDVNA